MTSRRSRIAVTVTIGAVAIFFIGRWAWHEWVRSRADAILRKADFHLLVDNDLKKAEQEVRWLLNYEPHHAEALLILGVSLNRQERLAEAVEAFEQVSADSTFYVDASFSLASTLMRDAQYERAEVVLKEQLQRHPESTEARELYRTLLTNCFRDDEAIAFLTGLLQVFPDDSSLLVEFLKTVGQFQLAQGIELELESVNRRRPGQANVVAALARAYWLKGEIEKAESLYSEVQNASNVRLGIKFQTIEFLLETGHLREARTLFEALPSIESVSSTDFERQLWWRVTSRLQVLDGKFKEALASIDRAIAIPISSPLLLTERSSILRRLRRTDEAVAETTRAVELGRVMDELFRLSKTIDDAPPTVKQCRGIADLLSQVGYREAAAGWSRLAEKIALVTR